MKKLVFLFIFMCLNSWAQETIVEESKTPPTIEYNTQREFNEKLNEKYSGADFKYSEEKPKPKKERKQSEVKPPDMSWLSGIAKLFPYMLGILIVAIIIKAVLNTEGSFWSFKKVNKNKAEIVITEQEEEKLSESELEKQLQQAITNKNYRRATRFYYLIVLNTLKERKLINYHKEKTNSDYLFELKKPETRKQFSTISRIYDYVWYGEFLVDDAQFEKIKNEYQYFLKNL